jgi:flagellar protein FliL
MSDSTEKPARSRGAIATLVIALTIGLIAGAGIGSMVVGPLLADSPGDGIEADCEALFAAYETEMRPLPPAAVYTIESLIVNPAGSGGSRYLMASIGFGLRDAATMELVKQRDAALRDIVIRILSSRSVAELSDPAIREELKAEMRAEAARLIGSRALMDIYFPQFVLQ